MDATELARRAVFRLVLELEAERVEKQRLQDRLVELLDQLNDATKDEMGE